MRLAIVIPGFQANERDWCIPAFTNLAQELARSVDLHVFTLRYPPRRDLYRIGRVKVHSIGGGAVWERRFVGASLLKLWRDALTEIAAEHRRAPFRAIVGIWATESGWLATRAGRLLDVPTIVHLAGGELTWLPQIKYGNQGRGLARLLVVSSLKSADLITVPSSPIKRALLRNRSGSAGKARNWALGVDTQMFSPAQADESQQASPFTFVAVGSLVPVKDYGLVLRALAIARQIAPHTDFRLRIVGVGPLRQRLARLVDELDLMRYVEFMGEVPHEQLPYVYRDAHAFVIGSWHEAQCMAALEAMSCGLPWIGPRVGALADAAASSAPERSGVPVTSRTPQAFAQAIHYMVTRPKDVRLAWGRNARARVERDYDLQRQAGRLLQLISALTAARQGS